MRTHIYRLIYIVVAVAVALPYIIYLLHLDLSGRAITAFSLITSFSEPAPLRLFSIFVPGTQILMAALVLHRTFRFIHDRGFAPPTSFTSLVYWLGAFGVVSLLLTILAFGLTAISPPRYSAMFGWTGVLFSIATTSTLPLAFAICELLSFKTYFRRVTGRGDR